MSVAFAAVELCAGASDLGQDVLGLGRPNVGLRLLVVLEKILFEFGDQLRQAVEDPTPEARDGEVAKKTLHHVEPRGAGRCEVEMETRVFSQPLLHLGVFVRGVVIEDEMQGPIRGRLRIDEFEKLQPFLMAMPVLATAQ